MANAVRDRGLKTHGRSLESVASVTPLMELSRVVDGGYCIGCGACAARPTGAVRMTMDPQGRFRAQASGDAPDDFAGVCPFSGSSENEDTIGERRFGNIPRHPDVGRHLACYAGHVANESGRANGSSGGLTTWLLTELLEERIVDGVIHVAPDDGERLFRYVVSTSAAEVAAGAKSRYYPVEMSDVLATLRDRPGRYAIVGVPCFIKAVNLLKAADPLLDKRLVVTVGIFCGHLKSARFAEYLAAQAGIEAADLKAVNFRHKYPEGLASTYGVEFERANGERTDRPMSGIFGNNWSYGFFKYDACNACDDVTAETADVAFGDAWLPAYVIDPSGTNVVVARRPELVALLEAGRAEGRIVLDHLDADTVALSQKGGLRDRREGLAYRLALKDKAGAWRPDKRVAPSMDLPAKRAEIYKLRLRITAATHTAWARARQSGGVAAFEAEIRPLTAAYDALYQPTSLQRMAVLVRRVLRKLMRGVKFR
jgi:coenzyme F420-reducing hydrogenase beta subunit